MSDTTFVDYSPATPIVAAWLNDANGATYKGTAVYVPSGTGAVAATTMKAKFAESVSALDFYANGVSGAAVDPTGVVDSTLGIQAAITYAVSVNKQVVIPGGTYLVTDTLSLPNKTQIYGEHGHQYGVGGTTINFAPTTAKSLFVPDGTPAAFRYGYKIEGLNITGNSTTSTGNSIYAIDVYGVDKGLFKNISISGFRTGIHCYATINNRFEFIQISTCYIQNVLYSGGFATTDVWEQCYFVNAPIGIQTSADNLTIRFNKCIFETLDTYGVNLVKECYGWMFTDCYVEDVPSANVSTNAMFRVGFDGTTLPTTTQLIINGGFYGGRNAGAVGALLTTDSIDGIIIGGGLFATRYTNVIKTSANTLANQIVATGWTAVSISAQVSDATKVHGIYPEGVVNSSSKNGMDGVFRHLTVGGTAPTDGSGVAFPATQGVSTDPNTLDDYDEYTAASAACTGAITTAAVWKLTKVGNQVTLTLPSTTGTATAAASFAYGTAIPAKYRPSTAVAASCIIKDNSVNVASPGMILINSSTGVITVYKDGTGTTNFTNAGTSGLGQGCGATVSWTI